MHENISSTDWRELVSRLIKSEMTKRKLKYDDLSLLLEAHGTRQTSANLRNKINRGIMGADLFIQLLIAMNVKQLDQESILDILTHLHE
ncbi:MAG: hypothetical protein KBT66_05390 [Amphritea sp.]|nr:hypothetical protein [Amphritea sp.]MBQ0783650.1 hypothetical protein [Amphritea sp.]